MTKWYEVKESERPAYLMSRARKLAASYGGDVRQVMEALCVIWGWDPKKYIRDGCLNSQNNEV